MFKLLSGSCFLFFSLFLLFTSSKSIKLIFGSKIIIKLLFLSTDFFLTLKTCHKRWDESRD